MLKHPFLNIPYQPKLQYLLGPFDVYDREETLDEEFAAYDINIAADRELLINKYIILENKDLNYRHRKLLADTLSTALEDKAYDFSQVLTPAPGFYCSLPWGWSDMENPRCFFEDINRLMSEGWKHDLQKASLEDPSTW